MINVQHKFTSLSLQEYIYCAERKKSSKTYNHKIQHNLVVMRTRLCCKNVFKVSISNSRFQNHQHKRKMYFGGLINFGILFCFYKLKLKHYIYQGMHNIKFYLIVCKTNVCHFISISSNDNLSLN